MVKENNAHAISVNGNYVFGIKSLATDSRLMGFRGKLDASSLSVKLSALRSATALQKYKEIQNSNDPDFAAQVLAHFGIKPKVDSRTSVFIGGDDKTLSINPNSKHNTNPSDAFDFMPYPVDWKDTKQFSYIAGIIIGIGLAKGIVLRWGGDWNQNGKINDERFLDFGHIEFVRMLG